MHVDEHLDFCAGVYTARFRKGQFLNVHAGHRLERGWMQRTFREHHVTMPFYEIDSLGRDSKLEFKHTLIYVVTVGARMLLHIENFATIAP